MRPEKHALRISSADGLLNTVCNVGQAKLVMRHMVKRRSWLWFGTFPGSSRFRKPLLEELTSFRDFGQSTRILATSFADATGKTRAVPTFVNEFWTARQRQAHSLHEVSYRACFKPQLPRFFIERLTRPGDAVYDPFMGRATAPQTDAVYSCLPAFCQASRAMRTYSESISKPMNRRIPHLRAATAE
jgi:hypothetical protein